MLTAALLTATAGSLTAPHAWAAAKNDAKKACLDAYDKAQRLRKDDHLVEAKSQLLLCAKDACPSFVRQDCTQWYSEVEDALPTVVLEAKGPDGQDAIDVKVLMDGQPLVDQIDGKSVAVNPGVHEFEFQMEGQEPVKIRVVVHEAVKNRHIGASFKQKRDKAQTTTNDEKESDKSSSSSSASLDTSSAASGGSMTLPLVFGGVGVLGIAGFTYFGLSFDSKVSDLNDCKPNCQQSDIDSANQTRTLALVSGGVGVVSLGLATYFFLTADSPEKTDESAEQASVTRFDVISIPGGSAGVLSGTF